MVSRTMRNKKSEMKDQLNGLFKKNIGSLEEEIGKTLLKGTYSSWVSNEEP